MTFTSSTHHSSSSFFFNDTATTEIYTLSLHDALPIYAAGRLGDSLELLRRQLACTGNLPLDHILGHRQSPLWTLCWRDRKSTRLNSSHMSISYAVFCLKKKKKK